MSRYMPEMILDQVSEDYVQKGYQVEREVRLDGNLQVDLLARKNGEVIIVEVKVANRPISKAVIEQLNAYVKAHQGYKLVIAVASPPERKNIEVENLDELLHDYLNHHPPGELYERATHISFQSVSDVEIRELKVASNDEIFVSGSATLNATLQFGSDSDFKADSGLETEDSFEIKFNLSLGYSENGWTIVDSDDNSVTVDEWSLYDEA